MHLTPPLIAIVFMQILAYHMTYAQKFSAGFKAGVLANQASFGDKDDKDEFSHKFKPGFSVRGLINFPLKNDFSFQAETGYSQRGRKILFNEDTWENTATYTFIDASMMLRKSYKFYLGKNIPSDWFFNIGPQISYWLGGKGTVTSGGSYDYEIVYGAMPAEPESPDFDVMYVTDENRWLFGIDFGIGFTAPLRKGQKLFTEFRFTSGHTFYGTKTSAANRTLGFTDNMRSNEKTLCLSVAYVFGFDLQEQKKGKSTKDKEIKRNRKR